MWSFEAREWRLIVGQKIFFLRLVATSSTPAIGNDSCHKSTMTRILTTDEVKQHNRPKTSGT